MQYRDVIYQNHQKCRLCEHTDLSLVLELKPTPPANQFTSTPGVEQPLIPLDLVRCNNCQHIQLRHVVSPEVLFKDYVYVSGTSAVFRQHFRDYANDIVNSFDLTGNDLVVDIGSNDGTLLGYFKEKNIKILGIDPAKDIAEQANAKGIETINDFFSEDLAKQITSKYGYAKVIAANNAFAHIDDIQSVIRGVKCLLSDNGIFVFEVSYLLDVVKNNLFDTIYHEHLDYHAVSPLKKFFERHGLRFFKATRVGTHGGSLRGFVCHSDSNIPDEDSVEMLMQIESEEKIFLDETYKSISERISSIGARLRRDLLEAKKNGLKVAGFGAPAKATTLMYHFEISPDLVDYIVDDSPWKQGLYTPGLHIPVVDSSVLYKSPPDYIVVLAWNFAKPIISKHSELMKEGSKFIVPLPELVVHDHYH